MKLNQDYCFLLLLFIINDFVIKNLFKICSLDNRFLFSFKLDLSKQLLNVKKKTYLE